MPVSGEWVGPVRPGVMVAGSLALASTAEAVAWTTHAGSGLFAVGVWLFAFGTPDRKSVV